MKKSTPVRGGPILPAAPPAVDAPLADWESLWDAPFFCTADGRMHTRATWLDVFEREVREISSELRDEPPDPLIATKIPFPEWLIGSIEGQMRLIVRALHTDTLISPGDVVIIVGGAEAAEHWIVPGSPHDLEGNSNWDAIPDRHRNACQWHKRLLKRLFSRWRRGLAAALKSGAACLMARKNNILAPFERVSWDQWLFFKLEDETQNSKDDRSYRVRWHDPREIDYRGGFKMPASATGPQGERLYLIYVAPGEPSELKGKGPEGECEQWLLELLRDYPDQRPRPLQKLCEDSISMFPGLTKRGFQRALMFAQAKSGNRKWSEAGAPRKISAQIPAK